MIVTPTTSNNEIEDRMFNSRNNFDIMNRPNGTITSKSPNMLKSPNVNPGSTSAHDFPVHLNDKEFDGMQTEEALITTKRGSNSKD